MTQLPPELIDQVVNLVGHDPAQLHECAQVSRTFASIAQPLLFRKVALNKNSESNKGKVGSLSGFAEFLQHFPQLALHVKHLELTIPTTVPDSVPSRSFVLPALENVVAFTLRGPTDPPPEYTQNFTNIVDIFPKSFWLALEDFLSNRQITHVHLRDLYAFPTEILRPCSHLTYLKLHSVVWINESKGTLANSCLRELVLEQSSPSMVISNVLDDRFGPFDVTHLMTLSIEVHDHFDSNRLQKLLDAVAPTLQTLYISPHQCIMAISPLGNLSLIADHSLDFSRLQSLVHLSVEFFSVSAAYIVVWLIQYLGCFTSSPSASVGGLSLTIKNRGYIPQTNTHSPPWSDLDNILCRPFFKHLKHINVTTMGIATNDPIVYLMPIDLPQRGPKSVTQNYQEAPILNAFDKYVVVFTHTCDIWFNT